MRILTTSRLIPSSIKDQIRNVFREKDFDIAFSNAAADFEESVQAIQNEMQDGLLIPLDRVPIQRPQWLKIWALLPRSEANNAVLIHKEHVENSQRIAIPLGSEVWVDHQYIIEDLKMLRPDLKFTIGHQDEILEALDLSKVKYAISPKIYVTKEIETEYQILDLSAREFGHVAGQAAIAFIAKSDSPYGKILRSFYDQSTVASCNLERTIEDQLSGKTNIHVEQDSNGNFHLWVINSSEKGIQKISFSQSTKSGIIEKAINNLNK